MQACTRKLNSHDCWLGATVKDMANDQMQFLQTWVGRICHIHGCRQDENVTDMYADSIQFKKTWLLVRYNCNIHARDGLVHLLVRYKHRDIAVGLRQV